MKNTYLIITILVLLGACENKPKEEYEIKKEHINLSNIDSIDSIFDHKISTLRQFDEVLFMDTYDFSNDTSKLGITVAFNEYARKRDSLVNDIEDFFNN